MQAGIYINISVNIIYLIPQKYRSKYEVFFYIIWIEPMCSN